MEVSTTYISSVRRGRRVVLQPSVLQLPAGARVGLVGRNGSGKTSLLLALAGLLEQGRVASWGTRGQPASISIVMQRPPLLHRVRVATVARAHGVDAADMQRAAPGVFDTSLFTAATQELSGGQRQRLAAAIALARTDPLLLLDEPYANLDVPGRIALRQAIAERHRLQPELTSVVAAHAPSDLHDSCDIIVVISGQQVSSSHASELGAHSDLKVFEQRLAAALE